MTLASLPFYLIWQQRSISCSNALNKHEAELLTSSTRSIFEATYPLLKFLLLGPILRSLTQSDGDERERIFKRPPLPWRESRGATGVKTPDNQSGILKFHRLHRFKNKNQDSPVRRKKKKVGVQPFKKGVFCGPNELSFHSATWLMVHRLCHPKDLRLYQKGLTEWVG